MKAWNTVCFIVAAAAAGFAAGRMTAPAHAPAPRDAVEQIERERDEALARAQRAESSLQTDRRKRAETSPAEPEPVAPQSVAPQSVLEGPPAESADAADAATDPAAPTTPAERTLAVRELTAQIEPAFERGDGEKLLELMRRLATAAPEGREAAMELAVRVNDDVTGAGALRLDQYTFYTSLGDTAVRDLMLWSLDHQSPATFRVLSAYSLPWVVPKDKAIADLAGALGRESDVTVQQALVVNLAQMNDSRAQTLLSTLLADTTKDGAVRAQIATTLATTDDEAQVRALEAAAAADPDERVRSAAKAALVARDPPVDGFLVTIVFAEGAATAAGVRAGDILVTYDGRPARNVREIRELVESGDSADSVPLVVLRDGAETRLEIRRGRMGIQGRPVQRK